MKKTIGTLALLALGVALVLAPAPARAACSGAVFFNQSPAAGTYFYLASPGVRTTSTIQGSYWILGAGNTTVGAGVDNGSSPLGNWIKDAGFGGGVAIDGNWGGDTGIDGCPAGGTSMAIALTDVDLNNTDAYFAAACVARNGGAATQFGFGGLGTITLKPIPAAGISGSVRVVNDALVTIASPNFSSIYYSDGSPGCAIGNVIKQYDVWVQQVARNGAEPTNRNVTSPLVTNWTLGNTCNIGNPCAVNVSCTGSTCDAFFAVSPRFDSGFAVARVSGNSRRTQAGQTLANPPKVKVIKTKNTVPGDSR